MLPPRFLESLRAKLGSAHARFLQFPWVEARMFKNLMTSRKFAPLFWCQLCSALNDNFLKNALVMLILFGFGGAGGAAGDHASTLITVSGVVFIAPFFILSALGG